jgi:hypothetical protein
MSIVPAVLGGKLRRHSCVLGAMGLGREEILTLSGSSLTPRRLLASSIILFVYIVVNTSLVSTITRRVSLFSFSTNGSAIEVPETSPLTTKVGGCEGSGHDMTIEVPRAV